MASGGDRLPSDEHQHLYAETAATGVQTALVAGEGACSSDLAECPRPAPSSTTMHTTSRKQISQSSIDAGIKALTPVFVDAMVEACSLVSRGLQEDLCGIGFSECGVIISHETSQHYADLCRSLSPVFGDNACIPATAESSHKWWLQAYWLRLVVPVALGKAREHTEALMDCLRNVFPSNLDITGISNAYRFFLALLDAALHSLIQAPHLLDELPNIDLTVNDIKDNVHVTLIGHQASRIVVFKASAPPR